MCVFGKPAMSKSPSPVEIWLDRIFGVPYFFFNRTKNVVTYLSSSNSWFIHLNEPSLLDMWSEHPTYLLLSILILTMAFMSLKYALRRGKESRYLYLWFAALIHGMFTEFISYNVADINNFWHGQTSIMFAARRLPLHVALFYPATATYAYYAVEKLKLPHWVQPCAVGLFAVLIHFPYEILGVKFLWWTWHDTDESIKERVYHVPWISFYVHLSYYCTFAILLNYSRYFITGSTRKRYVEGSVTEELACTFITAFFTMPLAVLLQILPIYYLLKDGFEIHSEVIVCMAFTIYIGLVFWFDRKPKPEARRGLSSWTHWFRHEVAVMITIYYVFFVLLVALGRPQYEQSFGIHEPLGPASEKTQQIATSGVVYKKQKYVDPKNFDEPYDFSCTKIGNYKGPPDPWKNKGKEWYAVCGTPFPNRGEYIVVVWTLCAIGFFAFYNAIARSAARPKYD